MLANHEDILTTYYQEVTCGKKYSVYSVLKDFYTVKCFEMYKKGRRGKRANLIDEPG